MNKSAKVIKYGCVSVYSIAIAMLIAQVAAAVADSNLNPISSFTLHAVWSLETLVFVYVPFIIFTLGSFLFWLVTKNVKDAPYFCFGIGLALIVAKVLIISFFEVFRLNLWFGLMTRFADVASVCAMALATLFEFGANVYLTAKALRAVDKCDYKPISLRFKIPLGVMYVLMVSFIVMLSYVVRWSCVYYIGYAALTAVSSVMYHKAKKNGKWMGKTTVLISILKMIWSAVFTVVFMIASGGDLFGMTIPILGILAFSIASCITEIVAAKRAVKAAAKA